MEVYINNTDITPLRFGLGMNETKEQLEKSIKFAKYRLKQFSKEMLSVESANVAYNRLLVEKAVMVKELENLNQSKLEKFWQKFWRKATGKKLISDHF